MISPPAMVPRPPEELLQALGLTEDNPVLDEFARDLAARAGVPYAMVNIFTPDGTQYFVGLYVASDVPQIGRTMPGDHGYCPEVAQKRGVLVLHDVYMHPRFQGNPVVDSVGIRTYAGAPLIDPGSGLVFGTLCFVGPTALHENTSTPNFELIKERRYELMRQIYQPTALHFP
ncbi:GAF domain-containing protein [Streptomyces sp. MZ04]|uniref:GAF domain-containing protein n=1 Tax=Streptomyces sp. MZ04 TaxID=2559236 RepID=UPI00107E65B6|nr:GAF domain-containing protein [Streptomyces sp. MZ04]TGB15534.1 GAF domain-containing protein [Streptomyces sp. MZ04]